LFPFSSEFLGNPYSATAVNAYFCHDITLASIESQNKIQMTLKGSESSERISKCIDMIMPLMFESWMEMKPADAKSNLSSISQESSEMLKIIMDIIMELYGMSEKTAGDAKNKFVSKYQEKFEQYLLVNFPYIQDDASTKTQESGGGRCLYQNLNLAILYLTFTQRHRQRFWKHREKVFKFVEDCIVGWKAKDHEFNVLMKKFIRAAFAKDIQKLFASETISVFHQLIRKCNVDQSSYDPKLALVCEIIEGSDGSGLKKDSTYMELIPQMVQVIGQKEFVPAHIIKTVAALAKQGNPTVHECLSMAIVDIVKNLQGPLKVSGSLGDMEKWKREVANLVYWVNDIKTLQNMEIGTKGISSYVADIVRMKLSV